MDRVIAVDLQRPGHPSEGTFFNVPVESCITDSLGVEYFAQLPEVNDGPVAIVAPNPDTVAKAQGFRHGLIDAWRDAQRVSFAMFSRAPVVDGSRLHHESELLGSVNGADVVIVDDLIDTANTLVRAAQVCKASGAKNVFIWASHGLFTKDALRKVNNHPQAAVLELALAESTDLTDGPPQFPPIQIEECSEITKVVVTNTLPLPEWYNGKKVRPRDVFVRREERGLRSPKVCFCLTHATRPLNRYKQVVQVSVAPLLARRIEAAHYRGHAINEKETFVPDPEGTA